MKKRILFLGCNFNQIPYLKRIKQLGFCIIGTDKNPDAPGKDLCDVFYAVSYDEYEKLIKIGIDEKFNSDDKIFTASSQFAYIGLSKFASYFNIPFMPFSSVLICLDKSKLYPFLKNQNISIPKTWYVNNTTELTEILVKNSKHCFYLKSDFSKNPNYVYKIQSINDTDSIFWGQDRYLQNVYILQKEVVGKNLRINIFGDYYNIISFSENTPVSLENKILESQIIKDLKKIIAKLKLYNFLIKFDIIISDKNYVVLDIGLDPPSRMKKIILEKEIDFYNLYVRQYLLNELNYPKLSE